MCKKKDLWKKLEFLSKNRADLIKIRKMQKKKKLQAIVWKVIICLQYAN